MTRIEIVSLSSSADDEEWDDLIKKSINGTFLHSTGFSHQRKGKYSELRLGFRKGQRLVGGIVLAEDPEIPGVVCSHPGLTYGGIVHDRSLVGTSMASAVEQLVIRLRESGFRELTYKVIPACYQIRPSDDDVYFLFEAGARVLRRDLNCVVDLSGKLTLSSRRKRQLRKAANVRIEALNGESIDTFWKLLSTNLAARHSVTPVHSAGQLRWLVDAFPENVEIVGAFENQVLVAGVVWFKTPHCWHAQYIASSSLGRELGGVDKTIEDGLNRGQSQGARFLSLGISNDPGSGRLNDGLFQFKAEFGGCGQQVLRLNLPLT